MTVEPVPGQFTLVLHTHLPWLAHHGRWPVGEEWLYQSWSAAYLPLMRVLRTLAAEDRRGLVTLGMTPVVTAQLDDPYCLDGMHHWLANWQLRAREAANLHTPTGAAEGTATTPEALRAVRYSRVPRGRPRARGLHHAVAPRRQPAAARAHRRRHHRAARRAAGASVPAAAATRGCASSRCARDWPTPSSGSRTPRRASGRRSAPTPPAWSTTTPPPVSVTSWSTARRCTATPRWAGRSATPMSWRSAATCRSATGSGRRSRATRGTPPTATSTPTTTSPGSSRRG